MAAPNCEKHFQLSGFRDKNLAAPPRAASHSARFDEAVARLHGEALTLVAHVGGVLDP